MKQLTGLAALVLLSTLYCTCSAFAAKESFEIDLNELRPSTSKYVKSRHRTTNKIQLATSKSVGTDSPEGHSSYVIKPGDHLFLILMRHYGLSNDAAERLIPEVMRLNGIRNPRGLTVGQHLTIPLPEAGGSKARTAGTEAPPAEPVRASRTDEQPQRAAQTEKSQPIAEANERQVTISVTPPCVLARTVIEHLGLLTKQIKPQPDSAFTAGSAGLKIVVACDLAPEESYTYGRLLAMHNVHLLVFKGDEPPRRVIEELASQLGFSFHMADPAAPDSLPMTYVFPAEGPYDQDVRLTIGAAAGSGTSNLH